MGEGENARDTNMIKTAIISCLVAASIAAPLKDLPVLFQFQQPTHNVAVFRGADLKNAIASGLVKGFPGASGLAGAVATKTVVAPVVHHAPVVRVAHPVAHRVAPAPYVPAPAPAPAYKPAPVVKVAPA